MALIPIEFRNVKYPSGEYKPTAGVSIAYVSNKEAMDKIDIVEQNFAKLQMNIQNKMKNLRKKENIVLHWEIGDEVYRFFKETEDAGFLLEFKISTLADFIGMSRSFWYSHLKFRTMHPTKDSVSKNIAWFMYVELIKIQDDEKRKDLELQIVDGKIKRPTELRLLKSKEGLSEARSEILS